MGACGGSSPGSHGSAGRHPGPKYGPKPPHCLAVAVVVVASLYSVDSCMSLVFFLIHSSVTARLKTSIIGVKTEGISPEQK